MNEATVIADHQAAGRAFDVDGVQFDLPGLGLAQRTHDFDYSWSGLGAFARTAIDALGLEQFHLLVHDIRGPVGFEVAAAIPERVRSITILKRRWLSLPSRSLGRCVPLNGASLARCGSLRSVDPCFGC